MKKYDVFISYSRKDSVFAEKVCAVFDEYKRHYKFEYFFDREAITSEHDYIKRISKSIAESQVMLFLASEYSTSSEFCLKELLFADKKKVHIHQYRIDNSELPDDIDILLGNHHYREYKDFSIENMVREVLANALKCEIKPLDELSKLATSKINKNDKGVEAKHKAAKETELERAAQTIIEDIRNEAHENIQRNLQHILGSENIQPDSVHKLIRQTRIAKVKKIANIIFATGLILFGVWSTTVLIKDNIQGKQQTEQESTTQAQAQTEKIYKVGDYYNDGTKEGVVFDIWDGGKHGKIVSLNQEHSQWCSDSQYNNQKIIVGTMSRTDGKANTNKVMARADSAEYPAFVWCRHKGKDWYLPALDELELLLLNDSVCNALNQTLKSIGGTKLIRNRGFEWPGECEYYWSSTEIDDHNACVVDVYSQSTVARAAKFSLLYVRAVAQF